MGFTPLEGLMMGTRSGSIDPSIVLHVQQHRGMTAGAGRDSAQSRIGSARGVGYLGRHAADSRSRACRSPASPARLAVYTRRVRQAIGALAVTLGGVDALVFTAGVGEHAGKVREAVCVGLECLGLELDVQANASCRPDADVARHGSCGRILAIATREDVTMLQEVTQVLDGNRTELS